MYIRLSKHHRLNVRKLARALVLGLAGAVSVVFMAIYPLLVLGVTF